MPRGKSKGSAFERACISDITKAFECFGIAPQDAYRSILSGGHELSSGDITMSAALRKHFPFAIECKFWKSVNLHELFIPWDKMPKHKNQWGGWWKQTVEGAEKSALTPLLIFKTNKQEILVSLPVTVLTPLQYMAFKKCAYFVAYAPVKNIRDKSHKIITLPWAKFLASHVEKEKAIWLSKTSLLKKK